ncbi:MAG: DUF3578 domain-containing protein [Clostridia bacterium]|nr:DUF3578 domain-containing protein [Clostridia bacterium]
MDNSLKNMFYRFINEYANLYAEVNRTQNYRHPFGSFIRNDIPNEIRRKGDIDQSKYIVKGSNGAGRWTTVPWIAIFDRRITESAQRGVYLVYLLNKDKKELYLTLNQGATDVSQNGAVGNDGKLAFTGVTGSSNAKSLSKLRSNAVHIQSVVGSVPFSTDELIKCGAPNYDAGAVCYKKYTLENLPDDQQLFKDLKEFIAIYARYAEWYLSGASKTEEDAWWPSQTEYPLNLTKEDWKDYILNIEMPNHPVPMRMLKAMMELDGEASCKKLSDLYGGHPSVYAGCAMNIGRRVKKHFNLPACMDGNQERYFPFPFLGKYRGGSEDNYIYRVRPELHEALQEIDLSAISPYYVEEHKTGKFDSWEIVDETTAIKTCDKSFFDYNGSGVPKEICWFFDAENISNGSGKSITLIFNGKEYSGSLKNDTTDRRRIQIRWNSDLGRLFDTYKNEESKATFTKKQTGVYEITLKGGEKEMTIKERVAAIRKYIEAKGFNYDGSLIENFYLGLKSKPFVILAGTSGTGKTRLVRLFAEAIKAEYKLVSVRPDWSDSSDLFGHVDLNQKFVPGAIIDFVKQAELNPTKPYFLCLDEMNLARVEYYMSDILSAIETRRYESGMIITDPVVSSTNYGNDTVSAGRYGKVILPGNLYIVGTVNMDETAFPFSKKVLDRANTIEFSYVDLLSMPSFSTATADKITVTNEFLVSKYITLNDCDAADREYIGSVCTTLSRINSILEIANAHIGYRVRDEIVFYMLNNREADLLDDKVAFDNQIMQKILPRVQGSSESIKTMLGELLKICESEKYEASAKKINFMIKRYEEDGFTSYWL